MHEISHNKSSIPPNCIESEKICARKGYNMLEIISRVVDGSEFIEYKKEYGKTIVCGTAKIGGFNVGIVANQKINVKTKLNEIQIPAPKPQGGGHRVYDAGNFKIQKSIYKIQ